MGGAVALEAVPLLHARTGPIGLITRDAFDRIVDEMLALLDARGPFDAVLLANHGAAVSEEHADVEAIVDLTGAFESGGGTMSMQGRLGQVVFTATQFDNVDRVLFWLDGEPVEFFGGEGIVLDEPMTRSDVPREFTGGIIIDAPEPGATVQSPFTVTGEGDLFEGYSAMWVWRDGERVLCNPKIVRKKKWEFGEEGCLSFPGIQAEVERSVEITVAYQDLNGDEQQLKCDGWLARIVQHEIDHLEGVFFVDRLTATEKLRVKQQLLQLEEDYQPRA